MFETTLWAVWKESPSFPFPPPSPFLQKAVADNNVKITVNRKILIFIALLF